MAKTGNDAVGQTGGVAIIGKLPGYNDNIDEKREFQKNLMKGITFIDLTPVSYKLASIGGAGEKKLDDFFSSSIQKLLTEPGLFERETEKSSKMFKDVLTRIGSAYTFFGGDSFSGIDKIRIVAANDSTFTESFSTSYGDSNTLSGAFKNLKNSKLGQWTQMMTKGISSMSHANLLNLVGNAALSSVAGKNNFSTLLGGAAFGMNIATPLLWDNSSYQSNLTVFIKLVSPIGTEQCIQHNILKPLMYLLAASSPVTSSGILTGVPMLWDVNAMGVTNFRIGAITSMSVIRGSFETTFNQDLQPTILDVRLTITPLLTDFAVQSNVGGLKNIYEKDSQSYFGVQNPSDIANGTLNSNANIDKIVTIKI